MNLKCNKNSKSTVISICEERLDAHNSADLKNEANRLFDTGETNIVIDLQEVRFIDSSGLGVLVSGFKNASSRQGSFRICGLQPQVRSMFELTRLHRVFEIFPTTEEALEDL